MSSAIAPAPRTGSALLSTAPSGARSAVRGAVRAVAATVGAVLAGLVLALPAAHLTLAPASTGPQTAVVSSLDHRALAPAGGLARGVFAAPEHVTRSLVAPVGLVASAAVHGTGAPAALTTAPAPAAAWVLLTATLLAAALVGVCPPPVRHRSPLRPPHQGPAPLRGPPAPPAPAP